MVITIRRLAITLAAVLPGVLLAQLAAADNDLSHAEQRTQYWQTAPELRGNALDAARRAELGMELHNLQLQIERFSVDHRTGDEPGEIFYPLNLSQLTMNSCCSSHVGGTPYIDAGFYPNPWTAADGASPDAVCVPCRWTPDAVGNFSYLLQFDNFGVAVAYVLIGWGPDQHGGLDIDGDGKPDGAQILLCSGALRSPDGWVYRWDEALKQAKLGCWENGRRIEIEWRREMDEQE